MKFILAIWATSIALFFSLVLSFHLSAFQISVPSKDLRVAELFTTQHFISGKCECSGRVLNHLISRGPIFAANETVYLIDGSPAQSESLSARGFKVEMMNEDLAFQTMQIEAVPFMRIAKQGKILYGGAYGPDQKHSGVYEDELIISKALAGQESEIRPVFGCINGLKRKNVMDIMGFKYGT